VRRQTAQFWAYLSILVAITLFCAGVSFAVSIPQVTEFTDLSTVGSQDFKPLASVLADPNDDEMAAVQARAYREKQDRWYIAAGQNLAKAAREEAARKAAASVSARSNRVVKVESSGPVVPSTSGVEQWRDEVSVFTDWNVSLMLSIMKCESGGNPNAHNRSGATGLFQILGGPYNPIANIALAHTMWSTRGTQPWAASSSCW